MNSKYRTSLLAAAVAALIAASGWVVAEQSQPGSRQYPSPMSGPQDSIGGTAPAQQVSPPATSPTTQADSDMDKPLYAKTPDELDNLDVIGANGEDLGKVKMVVRDRLDNGIYAVISAGGILGYGAREVPIPLVALQLNGDKLQLTATEEDLKAKPEYQPEQYLELQPPDRPISEFSAFESDAPRGGGTTPSP